MYNSIVIVMSNMSSSNSNKSDALKAFQTAQSAQTSEWQVVSRRGKNSKSINNESTTPANNKSSNIGNHLQNYKDMKDRKQAEVRSYDNNNKKFTRDFSVLHNIRDKQDQRRIDYEATKQYIYRRPKVEDQVKESKVQEPVDIDLQSDAFPDLGSTQTQKNLGVWGNNDKIMQLKDKKTVAPLVAIVSRPAKDSEQRIVTEINVMTYLTPVYSDLLLNKPLETEEPVKQVIDDDGFQTVVSKKKGKKSVH